ncbi:MULTISPECIES: hypothetical protein [Pseudomonas]|uniref:hypothetical protein n=1 Tax=Pseudomonas TaxID=286 RepID=UPI000BA49BA9|nr:MULTISPECIES: hypothetical protein [Pseudomonas]MDR9860916.1 hypothetical protein [Pseudomonas baetica]
MAFILLDDKYFSMGPIVDPAPNGAPAGSITVFHPSCGPSSELEIEAHPVEDPPLFLQDPFKCELMMRPILDAQGKPLSGSSHPWKVYGSVSLTIIKSSSASPVAFTTPAFIYVDLYAANVIYYGTYQARLSYFNGNGQNVAATKVKTVFFAR